MGWWWLETLFYAPTFVHSSSLSSVENQSSKKKIFAIMSSFLDCQAPTLALLFLLRNRSNGSSSWNSRWSFFDSLFFQPCRSEQFWKLAQHLVGVTAANFAKGLVRDLEHHAGCMLLLLLLLYWWWWRKNQEQSATRVQILILRFKLLVLEAAGIILLLLLPR